MVSTLDVLVSLCMLYVYDIYIYIYYRYIHVSHTCIHIVYMHTQSRLKAGNHGSETETGWTLPVNDLLRILSMITLVLVELD